MRRFSGIIDPFQAVIGLVGNGLKNGGQLMLDTEVTNLRKSPDGLWVAV